MATLQIDAVNPSLGNQQYKGTTLNSTKTLLQKFINDIKETVNLRNKWITTDVLFELFNGLGLKERTVKKMEYNKWMGRLAKDDDRNGLFSRREFTKINGKTKTIRLYLCHDGKLDKTSDIMRTYKAIVLRLLRPRYPKDFQKVPMR